MDKSNKRRVLRRQCTVWRGPGQHNLIQIRQKVAPDATNEEKTTVRDVILLNQTKEKKENKEEKKEKKENKEEKKEEKEEEKELKEMKDIIKQNMHRLAGITINSEFAAGIIDRINKANNYSSLLIILTQLNLYGAGTARTEANIKVAERLYKRLVQICHINIERDATYQGCHDGMLSAVDRIVEKFGKVYEDLKPFYQNLAEAMTPYLNNKIEQNKFPTNDSNLEEEDDDDDEDVNNMNDLLTNEIAEIKEVISRIAEYDPTAATKLRKMINDI
jgi:hypothetical protein